MNCQLAALLILFSAHAQTRDLKSAEMELVNIYREGQARYRDYEAVDSIRHFFKDKMVEVLSDKASFNYSFDSLSKIIEIIKSEDGKLKIYSWDEFSDGTWHYINAIAQYETAEGIKLKQLVSGNEALTGKFTDAIYYQIYQVKKREPEYLVFGGNTHGAGHHYFIARVLRIENDTLVDCQNCLLNKIYLVIQAPRSEKIDLEFDEEVKELSYNEFILNEEIGFYLPTGKRITLLLKHGVFIKQ